MSFFFKGFPKGRGLTELRAVAALGTGQFLGQRSLSAALLFACFCVLIYPVTLAAQSSNRHRVLVLYWDNKDFPGNVKFDESFKAGLRARYPEGVEYYPEYLETSRFPGQNLAFFRDYLRQKYAGRDIDVLVANADVPLNFLLQYRSDLFPRTPIVFIANEPPKPGSVSAGAGLTGIVHQSTYRETLELALRLHPDTKQVFVISGSREHDKRFENVARSDLAGFEGRVQINYLTDLPLSELTSKVAGLPPQSIALYVWQQATDERGRLLETYEVLDRISPTASAPLYGMGSGNLGHGIVGGYLQGPESNGNKAAEMTVKILDGARTQELSVESAPTVIMFDSTQLKRWQISENNLPPGSVVRFRQANLWQQYRWYIVGIVSAFVLESMLIAWLLLIRAQRRRAELENERLAATAEAERKKLAEVVSNVPGVVWETRMEPNSYLGKTTFISDQVEAMMGYTPDEWMSQPAGFGSTLIPDESDRDRVHADYVRVIESGRPGSTECRWRTKDGRVLWVESHVSPVISGLGKVVGLRGVTLDVTQSRLAEQKLRATRQTSEAMVRAIPDIIFLHTADGVYVDYHCKNPSDLILPPEQFLGRNVRDVLPPDLAEAVTDCFARVEDGGEPQITEYKLALNGNEKWFEARVVRAGDLLLSVVRDITERKVAELAMQESEVNYRSIFNAANDAVFVHDLHTGDILDANQRMCEMYGYTVEEVKQLKVGDFSANEPPYTQAEALQWIRKAGAGEPQVFEWRARHKAGRLFWVEVSLKHAVIGNKDCLLAVVRDITERKRTITELRASQERFSKSFRANPQPMSLTTIERGRYVDVNDSFLSMSGYAREDVIGHTSLELGVWGSPETRNEFIARLKRDGSIVNAETVFYGKDDRNRTLLSSAELIQVGGEDCLLMASSDITDRKVAEAALLEAHQELVATHEEVNRLKNQLQEENIYLKEEISLGQDFGEIVGQSDALKYVLFKIEQVAPTETTVLIFGETGTGKELVARAIHNASARKHRPLVRVNCAALSPTIIESELFGHERGAFTGATARKIGRFELADGATIFLDEIGELPPELQVKLLRVIQEGELERLGNSKTISVDVRIIAATNRNLEIDVRKGLFREDLWYRLNVFPITVPPLRQRRDDIKLLVEHFVRKFSAKLGKVITSVSPGTLKNLSDYNWPGNVRELANVIERATITANGSVLRISDDFGKLESESNQSNQTLEEMERDYIIRILADTNWRIEGAHGAARILGMNPSTLRTRMTKLSIERPGQTFANSAN